MKTRAYANDVLTRLANLYIHRLCRAISLNSVSKFKIRVLPSILAYRAKTEQHPTHLLFALGMLIRFYRLGTPQDDGAIIERICSTSTAELPVDTSLWGMSLSEYAEEVDTYANIPV